MRTLRGLGRATDQHGRRGAFAHLAQILMQGGTVEGSLISCDVPTKQLIVYINRENQDRIILRDLDDTHVLIDSRYVSYLQEEVARLLERNMYDVQTQQKN